MTTAANATRPSLTRQAGALASGSFATQVLAVIMLMALARLVSKPELGGYQQLALIYGILQPLLIGGIPAALLYFVPRSDDAVEQRVWLGHAYLLLGSSGFAISVLFALARQPLADALGNPALAGPLLVYAPLPFFAFIASVATTGLVAVRHAGVAAALSAFTRRAHARGGPRRRRHRARHLAHGGRPGRCGRRLSRCVDLRGASGSSASPFAAPTPCEACARCWRMDCRWP